MSIFTRFRDIISSNINAMLDKAEDPEKLIKLMIREMEDTLVELKSSCAGVIAQARRIRREMGEAADSQLAWENRATLAVRKGRDDLAREALTEKRACEKKQQSLEREAADLDMLIEEYQDDIRQLENKLESAKEKQRLLVERHIHAVHKRRAQEDIRRMDNSDAIIRFENLENRIDRMEAEAEMVNFGKDSLEGRISHLALDEEIERELENLKSSLSNPMNTVR
ncbi:MAG TPA: phage shock protein A [Desulfobacteraceae bacterium]|nr:phage shock protein A [Desulfobacteraceae bacterium]